MTEKYEEICQSTAKWIADKGIALEVHALATIKALTLVQLMALMNTHPDNKD